MTQDPPNVPEIMTVIYAMITLIKRVAARLAAWDQMQENCLAYCDVVFLGSLSGRRAQWV
jgi:hypothetical protein